MCRLAVFATNLYAFTIADGKKIWVQSRSAKFKFGKIWIGTIKYADLHVKIQNPCGFRSLAFEKSDIKICIIF